MPTYNEFQRELQRHNIEAPVAYMFTMMYEQMSEMGKQLDDMAKIVELFANQLQGFVTLREIDAKDLEVLKKRLGSYGKVDGVEVKSVANEPE